MTGMETPPTKLPLFPVPRSLIALLGGEHNHTPHNKNQKGDVANNKGPFLPVAC